MEIKLKKQDYVQNKDRMLSRTVHAWNIDITWKHYKNKLMVKWWKWEWKD